MSRLPSKVVDNIANQLKDSDYVIRVQDWHLATRFLQQHCAEYNGIQGPCGRIFGGGCNKYISRDLSEDYDALIRKGTNAPKIIQDLLRKMTCRFREPGLEFGRLCNSFEDEFAVRPYFIVLETHSYDDYNAWLTGADIKAYLLISLIEPEIQSEEGPAFASYTVNHDIDEIDETKLLDKLNDDHYLTKFNRAIKALGLDAPHTELTKEVEEYESPSRNVWRVDPSPEDEEESSSDNDNDSCDSQEDTDTVIEEALPRYKTTCVDCGKAVCQGDAFGNKVPELMWLAGGELAAMNVDDQTED
ncbi:MAG: hypothetical protein Q9174_005305 [Haloplaca sp. 1 TL-2023]